MIKRVGEGKFKRIAFIGLFSLLLVTIGLATFIPSVGFDYDFEKFFPLDDEETNYFFAHREKFESDNDFLLIAIQNEDGIFQKDFLKKVDSLTGLLEKEVPYVQFVTSITKQKEQIIFPGGGGSASRPYIDFTDLDLKRDSLRIYRSKELINVLVSEDASSVCLFLRHDDYISKKKSDEVLASINKVTDRFDFDKVRVAGRVIGQSYYINKMTFELTMFVGMSGFLIVFFLLIAFRSGWGIILPLIVIAASLIWLVGFMGVFNEPINIILTTLPSIMFVVSMSDVIHLVSRYLDALRTGLSKYDAIILSIKEVGFATFLTSFTTAVGFFTLYFVKVEPIQKFGVVVGFGVMIAFVLTFISLPFLFYLTPAPSYVRDRKESNLWAIKLRKWFLYLIRNKKKVIAFYVVLALICIGGISMIKTNNFLMDDLKNTEEIKQDFNYLDEHYGGVRPFELAVTLKDTNLTFWDQEVMADIDKVERYLEKDFGVTIKSSLNSMVKVMNRSSHAGNPDYFELPESSSKMKSIRRMIRIAAGGKLYNSIVDSTGTIARITGTIPDWGNMKVTEKNKQLLTFISSSNLNSALEFRITGTAHLVDKNMRYLATSLVWGLGVSMLIVALIMGIVYKSFTMMMISMIPNVFPLIVIGGIMGYTGIELKTSTSIIFTIAFGIAVDDTIHLLGKFKFELMKGRSVLYAMKRAYLTTGKAMILTTLILCSGFLLLVFSTFMGTFNMGVLLSITLFVALIADLTLLPVLILLFYRPKKKRNKTESNS
jgi:uncharacterized protein